MVAPLGCRCFISFKVYQTFQHREERPTIQLLCSAGGTCFFVPTALR
jgi:hypothetical protein